MKRTTTHGFLRSYLLTLFACLSFAGAANATLIEMDLFNAGDGLLTLDYETGFEWLDLTLTTGMSYNNIVVDGFGGYSAMGFVHATREQMCGLWSHAGADVSDCSTDPSIFSEFSISTSSGNLIVELLGDTISPNGIGAGGIYDSGLLREGRVGRGCVLTSNVLCILGSIVSWPVAQYSDDSRDVSAPGGGNWLLRSTTVPEPSALDKDEDGIPDVDDNCPNTANPTQTDFDEDGLGDACDHDDDGDGLSDVDEVALGSDPLNPDTDGDGVDDQHDPFPLDISQSVCPAGSYVSVEDYATCVPAPAGSYVPQAGADSATLCPVGSYQDQEGQSECIPAPVNTYVDQEGAISPTSCAQETYQDEVGKTSCKTAQPVQRVGGVVDKLAVPAGGTTSMTAEYSVSDGNALLSGLGVRVHYDSSILTWTEFSYVLPQAFIAHDAQPVMDSADLDSDLDTDVYLTLVWDSLAVDWPGEEPIALFTAEFEVSGLFETGQESYIRFSAEDTAAGYAFESTSVRLVSGLTLDVDGDGEVRPLTDGLLILRYLFGFKGETLIHGAVSNECTRCTAEEIEDYLDPLRPQLDIDADGEVRPLTDGLVILRYMFGFSGDALIFGVVSPDCGRCTAPEIESYIQGLYPNANSPVNANPIADAGTDQTVDEQTMVTITGSGTDVDGTIASYSWIQTDGTSVILNGADTNEISFTTQTTTEILIFQLTVTDDEGASHSDTVSIAVNHRVLISEIVFSDNALSQCVSDTGFGYADELTSLACNSMDIADATGIEELATLTLLDLAMNQLTSINVSANTALTDLWLSDNKLTSIDVSANTQLITLFLSNNELTSIDVSANRALTGLQLFNNQLTPPDVSATTTLQAVEGDALSIDLPNGSLAGTGLTYEILEPPLYGELSGNGSQRIYAANTDFVGTDSFLVLVRNSAAQAVTQQVDIVLTPAQFTLEVSKFGDGILAAQDGGEMDCNEAICTLIRDKGSEIFLTATPDSGWEFERWAGCDSVTIAGECRVLLDQSKVVYATFLSTAPVETFDTLVDLTQTDLDSLVDYTLESDSLFFVDSYDVSQLKEGQILMANGVHNGQPIYFARRITHIADAADGKREIATAFAAIDEIIKSGTLSVTQSLSASSVDASRLSSAFTIDSRRALIDPFVIPLNVSTEINGIGIEGSLNLTLKPDLALRVDWSGLKEFRAIIGAEIDQSLTVSVPATVDLFRQKVPLGTPIYFAPIPAGPLVFVPKIQVYVELGAEFGGDVSVTLWVTQELKVGTHYLKGVGWQNIGEYDIDGGFEANASVGFSMELGLPIEQSLLLYGVSGPKIGFVPYVRGVASVSVPFDQGCLLDVNAYTGIKATVGGDVSLLSRIIFEINATVLDISTPIYSRKCSGTADTESPTAPTLTSVTSPSSKSAELLWEAATDNRLIKGYQVYQNFQLISAAAQGTSYLDRGLLPDTQYCYYLSAMDEAGNTSLFSNTECITTAAETISQPPAAPLDVVVQGVTSNSIDLAWSASTDDGEVKLYSLMSERPDGSLFAVTNTTTTTVTLGNLQPNTEYCYIVVAVDEQGNQSDGSAQICQTTDVESSGGFVPKACDVCPEMVEIPGGTFQMGDLNGGGSSYELPVHEVTVPSFAMGKYEVTFDEYDAFANDTGSALPSDGDWGRGSRPVINVSWDDAKAYAVWLSSRTGLSFRLPSEAEWEYAARAGSTTVYPRGDSIGTGNANCYGSYCGDSFANTAPVGSFPANVFGLYDMHGNVWEWVEDCWNDDYQGAPIDGSAWTSGNCGSRVLRGGSWYGKPWYLRSAYRLRYSPVSRRIYFGFRLAQDLTPILLSEIAFPDSNLAQCVQNTGLTYVDELTFLICEDMGIADASGIGELTTLIQLHLYNNQLTTIDLSGNTALKELGMMKNQLTAIDISANTALTVLDLRDNQLTAIDVSANTALIWLGLDNNQLAAIDVSANTGLIHLHLDNNQLTTIDVSANTLLEGLILNNNQLTAIDVSTNTVLRILYLRDNQLTAIDVSAVTALQFLNVEGNPGIPCVDIQTLDDYGYPLVFSHSVENCGN